MKKINLNFLRNHCPSFEIDSENFTLTLHLIFETGATSTVNIVLKNTENLNAFCKEFEYPIGVPFSKTPIESITYS